LIDPLGLYIHVPFCSSICNYCNFNRGLFDEPLKTRYVEALLREISLAGRQGPAMRREADTVYFGGGTPSLLEPKEIEAIIGACRDAFDLSPEAEVTLEANPETVDAERLSDFRRAGVNRLSFGVQSFRDEELRRLDRRHSARRAEEAIAAARTAGLGNLSLDLMMWLPEQTVDQWMASVDRALGVAPEHLSLYMLEVYPHLPLKMEMTRQNWNQLPDDAAADMYEASMALLEAAGYEQYEISNLARPGRRSRHNLKYWSDGAWLGFGPGAHSTRDGRRWKNVSSTLDYIERLTKGSPVVAECWTLSNHERLGDALFTGLRLTDGVDIELLSQRYFTDIWKRYGERLAPYLDAQLLLKEDNRLRLTRQGMLLAHEVMMVFV
jgi:putative oxygen-independent coproporphyrinogen III oxidase